MYEQQHGGNNDGSILDQTRFQTATNTEPPIKAPLVKKGGSKMKRDKDSLGKKDLHHRGKHSISLIKWKRLVLIIH